MSRWLNCSLSATLGPRLLNASDQRSKFFPVFMFALLGNGWKFYTEKTKSGSPNLWRVSFSLFFFFNQSQNFYRWLRINLMSRRIDVYFKKKLLRKTGQRMIGGTFANQLHRDRSQNNQTWDKNGRWYHIQLKQKIRVGTEIFFPFHKRCFQ